MNKYIALLRGINVGGHKKFPKVAQLQMMETLGFEHSQAYIHTGNWMFQSQESSASVAQSIQQKIAKEMGWEVPVIVLSQDQLTNIVTNCPFSEEKALATYFVLLAESPSKDCIALLDEVVVPNEEFIVGDKCIYFYPALGAGKAKLNNNFFEKKLNVNATTRNFRTMAKLIEMTTSL